MTEAYNNIEPPFYEREPLLLWSQTPPPPYYNSIDDSPKSLTPPPTYQQIISRHVQINDSNAVNGPNDYQTISAIVFFCCCCSPLSCLALYYSLRVQQSIRNGDLIAAQKASRTTCCLTTFTVIVGTILLLIIIGGGFITWYFCTHKININ